MLIMNYSNIRAADLNLIIVFQVLMEEKHVSRAAEKLHLSQPAMSRAFQRLKHLFKDELLTRTSNGYEPTQKARALIEEFDQILPRLESILNHQVFDPKKIKATIRIAATDYMVAVIFPSLLKILASEAPGIEIDINPWNEKAFDDLNSNNIDLVLWVQGAKTGLRSEQLFREKFVCLVRKDHPIGNKSLTLKRYIEYPHIVISIMQKGQIMIERTLESFGLERKILVRTPYFVSAALLLEETDGILTVGKRLASKLLKIGKFREIKPPEEFHTYNYVQVWHPRTDSDPLMTWFRQVIKRSSSLE